MQKIQPLLHGQYYHIYNCGINGERLFRNSANYEYFLRLYEKYIDTVAETFAWCLMGNHFHLLVRIKEEEEINNNHLLPSPDRVLNPIRGITAKPPHLYFSHLFNAYSQAYNKMYSRHGGLFERPFKWKLVDNENYLRQVVLYIHHNPVHHGFCGHPAEYPWNSFLADKGTKPANTRNEVIQWFGGSEAYEAAHKNNFDRISIEKYLDS